MRTIKLLSTKPSRWLALGLAALASACAGITSTYSPNISTFYTPGVVRYAVQGGAMPLVVRGVALEGQSSEATASMAAANMRLPRWFQSVPFQAPPVEGAPSGNYRTVLLFNPVALSTDGGDACGPLDRIETGGPTDVTRIVAAFCTGDSVITSVRGSAPSDGTEMSVARLLTQVSFGLYPARNPTFDFDKRDFFFERPWR